MVWERAVNSSYAVGFDSNTYVSVAGDPAQLNFTGPFSVFCWVNLRQQGPSDSAIVAKCEGDYEGWMLWLRNNIVNAYFKSGVRASGITNVTEKGWIHVGMSWDGTTAAVWLNGNIDGSSACAVAPNAAGEAFRIGAYAFDIYDRSMRGLIDDVRIYNRALTAAEVQSIYRNSSSPPTDGLVAYFPMDEGTGTTTTDAIGGLTGTLTNGPTWQPQVCPRLRSGRDTTQSWGVSFDGTNDYVATTLNSQLNGLTQASLCFWFKRSAVNSKVVLGKGGAGRSLAVEIWTDGKVYLEPISDSAYGTFSCNDTNWHSLVMVFDGTLTGNANRLKGYLDGLEQSLNFLGAIGTAIGSYSETYDIGELEGNYTQGLIKDVRIYNSALSAADIAKLANNQSITATPVGHWKLDDGTGTTATDSSGNGNHGTLTNGPTWTGDIPQWFRPTIESSHSGSFDGVDDAIQLGSSSTLNPTTAMTVTAHIYVSESSVRSTTYWPEILSRQNAGVTSYHNFLLYNRSGNYRITLNSNVGGARYGSYDVPLQRWVPVAFSDNGSALSLWANGVQDVVSTGLTTTSLTAITGNSFIGNDSDWAGLSRGAFPGRIDEVCVHDIALPAAAIADAAAGYLVRAGLVSRYKLDGNANDSHGTNHGTEQGGVSYSSAVPATIAKRPRRSGLPFA